MQNTHQAKYNQTHKAKKNNYAKSYYAKNRERICARNRKHYYENKVELNKKSSTRYFKTMHLRRLRKVDCTKHQESIMKFANGFIGIIVEVEKQWKYIVYKEGKLCFTSYRLFKTKTQCSKDLQNCML